MIEDTFSIVLEMMTKIQKTKIKIFEIKIFIEMQIFIEIQTFIKIQKSIEITKIKKILIVEIQKIQIKIEIAFNTIKS